MNTLNAASLINLLGFTVGVALYALLLVMVVRHRRSSKAQNINLLLLTTSLLGLIWNVGELCIFIWKDFGAVNYPPILTAVSYSALGFLPSVVVHSAQTEETKARGDVRRLRLKLGCRFAAFANRFFGRFRAVRYGSADFNFRLAGINRRFADF